MPNQKTAAAPLSAPRTATSSRRRNRSSTRAAASPAQPEKESSSEPKHQGRKRTKQEEIAALLMRDEGTTITLLTEATGWLPHTVRAALTGLRKKGYIIDSEKIGDTRTYRAVAPR